MDISPSHIFSLTLDFSDIIYLDTVQSTEKLAYGAGLKNLPIADKCGGAKPLKSFLKDICNID